jgi:hypothetical protein
MAIKQSLLKTDENNMYKIDFDEAYYKIDACDIDANKETIRVGLRGYASEYARQQENAIGSYKKLIHINFSDLKLTEFSKDEILKAVYEWITTQEEFKNGEKI